MRTKKTQLRGQTAEVGGGKTVKNARGPAAHRRGERAPDDAKDLASRRGEFHPLPPRLAFRGWLRHPQPTHGHAGLRRRVRAGVTPSLPSPSPLAR